MRRPRLDLRQAPAKPAPAVAKPAAKPSIADVREWLEKAEERLLDVSVESGHADWIAATYIIDDSEILSAQANQRAIAATIDLVKEADRFEGMSLPEDMDRKLKLLKLSLTLPAPSNVKEAEELTRIKSGMEGMFGKGKYCPDKPPKGDDNKDGCLDLTEITRIMATSRDDAQLLEVWDGWHKISRPMKKPFVRYVELANKGAREIGFKDTGAMWRAKYDMPPDAFSKELDRLWEQVKPLYQSLHAYTRAKLIEQYGERAVNPKGPIPAHLLGNMWAQSWENLYPILAPPNADPGYDLTEILKRKKIDEKEMVRYGERFFTSLGFDPLPKTFWERSLFVKPRDRDVVCHASAWDVDAVDDLRLKMCIDIMAKTSIRSIMNSGITSINAPTTSSPSCSATAQTMASTRRSATPSRSRSLRIICRRSVFSKDAAAIEGHRTLVAKGAGEGRIPAVRACYRPVAMESVQRRNHPGEL